MKFIVASIVLLGLWGESTAAPAEFSKPSIETTRKCFQLPTNTSAQGPAGKLFQDNDFELVAHYPNKEVYEVRFTSKRSGGSLAFLGGPHITSPNPELFSYLEGVFDQTKPNESYIEVADVSYLSNLPKEKDIVIKTRGEPSYLGFVARKNDVAVLPLEPKDIDIYQALRGFYAPDQIVLTFVLRDAQLSRDRHRMFGERLENSALDSIKKWNEISKNAGDSISIGNVFELTKAVTKIWPGLDWRQVPADWFNPLRMSSETGGVFANEVVRHAKFARDRHYANLLFSRVEAGRSIVALAGQNHAFTLAVGLQCLLEMK